MIRVTLGSHICTKGFLNYFSVIVVFLNVVFNDEIVKFSKNCVTVKPEKKILEIFKNCKRLIIIINFHNGSGKPRKFSRSRMTKRAVPLNSSREI